MATFYNQATLSYNGTTTTSNIATDELLEVLSATKTALANRYTRGNRVTYIVSILNSGTVAFTNMTVTDNLGQITSLPAAVYPTTFVDDSIRYYVNGVLQTAPTVSPGPPLVITGVNIPAGGNADNVVVADTFNPILNPISVSFNGTVWTSPTNYTYNSLTGVFATVPGQITVPAATYTQDPVTGAYTIQPGLSTLTITGTV